MVLKLRVKEVKDNMVSEVLFTVEYMFLLYFSLINAMVANS